MFRTGSTSAGQDHPHHPGPESHRTDDRAPTPHGTSGDAQQGEPEPTRCPTERPGPAERARTLLDSNASAALTLPDGRVEPLGPAGLAPRVVTPGGDVVALVEGGSLAARAAVRAQGDELPAALEVTDVVAVAMPHRVRGRLWVAGWLGIVTEPTERDRWGALLGAALPGPGAGSPTAGGVLLRLEVGEADLADLWGTARVEPDALAAADPDPLVGCEPDLLLHLADAHHEQVAQLYRMLDGPPGPGGPPHRIVPVSLDRFGLRVRMVWPGHCWDARFDFPEPVSDLTGVRLELHRLFRAAAGRSG